ncbi:tetratricopeptide repeat protein [Geomonas sp. Red69]|uniref:tetratricopeptide repeat protein n=1 Tax=Geomonas diazotrophica TaxID=2843197 RepID=UPI001C12513B|nr:tetratricopeptide repeat protein [Geomonas diazotrophica]MBU5636470.1 tetratricopeptide repeat protein [Geomonas diazotrophica]
MRRLVALAIGLLLLVPALLALTALRKSTPAPERLGYRPSFEVTFFTSLEHRYLLSELLFYDAVFYYGTILDLHQPPDYAMLLKYVDTSTRLNPYNIDSYYFGQAILTWDAGLVKPMNHILERGVKKREWDFYMPFFIGFNNSYFLKDYQKAAQYMSKAAQLNPKMAFLSNLAGRFYYEANQTEQAVQYLKVVYEGTYSDQVRRGIKTRIEALETILFLEKAVQRYEKETGHKPAQLADLVAGGVLKGVPPDPYGGTFYYDRNDGRIKTTSKLAVHGAAHDRH